jgi:CPA1 family monovalent cation:H+ antiporter
LSRFSDDHAADRGEELKAERVVHDAADEVLAAFRADPPAGLDPRVVEEIRTAIARHSEDVDEMPDPEAPTKRAKIFSALYRDVLAAQREALITERDEGRIEDEAVRAMLERLDLQEAGVSARLESRF